MFWPKKEKAQDQATVTHNLQTSFCSHGQVCPRCGYPVEGLALVCPRCREELPRGCSGNCSACGK